jgi:hypothetical protein
MVMKVVVVAGCLRTKLGEKIAIQPKPREEMGGRPNLARGITFVGEPGDLI